MNFKCNYRKCRKELSSTAIVTSCSHIFCQDHNPSNLVNDSTLRNIKRKEVLCPVCKSNLGGTFDFVEVDLQPPDSFKGMVLTGLRPETIIEIAARALGFWMYQMEQELQYNHYVIKKQTDRFGLMENEFMKAYSSINEEKSILTGEKENLSKECEELREKLIAESRLVERLTIENKMYQNNSKSLHLNNSHQQNNHFSESNYDSGNGMCGISNNIHTQPINNNMSKLNNMQRNSTVMMGKNINSLMSKSNHMFISPDSTLNSPNRNRNHKTERANQLWGMTNKFNKENINNCLSVPRSGQKYLSPLDNILNKQPFLPYENNKKHLPNSTESVNSSQLSFGFK